MLPGRHHGGQTLCRDSQHRLLNNKLWEWFVLVFHLVSWTSTIFHSRTHTHTHAHIASSSMVTFSQERTPSARMVHNLIRRPDHQIYSQLPHLPSSTHHRNFFPMSVGLPLASADSPLLLLLPLLSQEPLARTLIETEGGAGCREECNPLCLPLHHYSVQFRVKR